MTIEGKINYVRKYEEIGLGTNALVMKPVLLLNILCQEILTDCRQDSKTLLSLNTLARM